MVVGSYSSCLLDEDDDAFVYYPHPTKFQDLFSVETRWLAEMLRASVFLERFSQGPECFSFVLVFRHSENDR